MLGADTLAPNRSDPVTARDFRAGVPAIADGPVRIRSPARLPLMVTVRALGAVIVPSPNPAADSRLRELPRLIELPSPTGPSDRFVFWVGAPRATMSAPRVTPATATEPR